MSVTVNTDFGSFIGNEHRDYNEFLGIRYAKANRFEYAVPESSYGENYDATKPGASCPQTRTYYEHLEIPERMFYYKEFRDNIHYRYSEDCLNLNIYTPKHPDKSPVIIFIHGGGFNSGSTEDSCFDGAAYAKRGIILVAIKYRVGVLGYFSHSDISDEFGHDGNFGLNDQYIAINWVKEHISAFGGDPDNLTLMGQSAGAISIQYLCLSQKTRGLFKHVIMMSGGGLFPKFSLPRPVAETHEYWLNFMELAGCKSLKELKCLDLQRLFDTVEVIKSKRKDTTFNTMPVVDGYLITDSIDKLIKTPNKTDIIIGYTNNDMYAVLMGAISEKYGRKNNGYIYYFDIDAPGPDKNGAFHSSDLRYAFGTLFNSHRPYSPEDYRASEAMLDYFSQFARTGNPNTASLPLWTPGGRNAMIIRTTGLKMGRPGKLKLFFNTLFKGDPKI